MTFRRLTDAELRKAEKHMKTPEFRAVVEAERARWHDGEEPHFPSMAKRLGIPVELLAVLFAEHVNKKHGTNIVPTGFVQ